MSTTIFLRTRFAALAAGALLTGVLASGCQSKTTTATSTTNSSVTDAKDGPRTIHHPPGGMSDVSKDSPPPRHRGMTAPAPITHPGG